MLAELSLDTVTYANLADLGRRRIPSVSQNAWTDHNAHDPGITLIELYAALLEQRVFWLNQVTPSLNRALLALLGVAPLRARAARTVLAATSSALSVLNAGQVITTMGADGSNLAFMLDEAITVLPCTDVALKTSVSGKSRTTDVSLNRTIVLFPNDGSAASVWLDLTLSSPWRPTGSPLSIFFELLGPPTLLPQWHPDAPEVPPPADLLVLASTPSGTLKQVSQCDDGTGGFRRSGVIRIAPPDDWSPTPSGTYQLQLHIPSATFSVPPRLVRLQVNAIRASHRVPAVHLETKAWPKTPGRTLQVHPPYDATTILTADRRSAPESISGPALQIREKSGWEYWTLVEDLTAFGPSDRVFAIDGSTVSFGDGVSGRQPVSILTDGTEWLRLEYAAGGGVQGNLAAGSAFSPVGNASSDLRLSSIVQAVEGRDDETLSESRQRAAGWQTEVTRAVLPSDLETLACTTPGVAIARAIAVVGFEEFQPVKSPGVVTVYVIPYAPRGGEGDSVESVAVPAPIPDAGALAAVKARLCAARLLGSNIIVRPPRYREVRLKFEATTRSTAAAQLLAKVEASVSAYLDPLIGGDEGLGWPLGAALEPSALLRVAQAVAGEGNRIDSVAIAVGSEPTAPACGPVAIGACFLPRLADVAVHAVSLVDSGGLR